MAVYKGTSIAAADRQLTNNVMNNWSKYADFYTNGGGANDASRYAVAYHAGSGSSSGGGSGSGGAGKGGGGGRGSGSSKPRHALNLKVYKRGQWDTNGLRTSATNQADARNREAFLASKGARMDANNTYNKSMREVALQEERNTRDNRNQMNAALAANANTALNRGMGYGGGYLQTQTNARSGYDQMLTDLMNQYAMERYGLQGDRNNIYAQMAEQDRVTRANRQALIDELFAGLQDSSWQRYLGTEGLRQNEIDSQNAAIQARYGSLYG